MKQLNEKLFKSTKLIKILKQKANVLDMILKQFPHVSNETSSNYVTLNNTAKAPMEIDPIPQTSQETTTGKNKLAPTQDFNITNNGVEFTGSNGIYTIKGTTTTSAATISVQDVENYTIQSGDYLHIMNSEMAASSTMNLMFTDNTSATPTLSPKNRIFDLSNYVGKTVRGLRMWVGANATVDLTLSPMIINGSEATSYEPYTGGIPAPNPDYPQEIHCTTGENVVKVVGKNLFDINNADWQLFSPAYPATYDNENKGWYNHDYMVLTFTPKETQTLSFKIKKRDLKSGEFNYSAAWELRKDNAVVLYNTGSSSITFVNINYTMESGHTYSLRIYNHVYVTDIQLEQSSSATSFTPYEETTYLISLGNKEMYNINNIADGFVYDESVDKFYINRNIGKVVLNGSESWKKSDVFYISSIIDYATSNNTPYSNYFVGYSNVSGASAAYSKGNNQIGFINKSDTPRFYVRYDDMPEVSNLINWLSTHNTTVVYQLLNSTLEEITDSTLISQLRAIKNALSMQGTTHIISTATGENLPFLIKARAVKSFE